MVKVEAPNLAGCVFPGEINPGAGAVLRLEVKHAAQRNGLVQDAFSAAGRNHFLLCWTTNRFLDLPSSHAVTRTSNVPRPIDAAYNVTRNPLAVLLVTETVHC